MLCTQLAERMSGSGEGDEGGVSVRSGILRNSQVTGGRERERGRRLNKKGSTVSKRETSMTLTSKGNEHAFACPRGRNTMCSLQIVFSVECNRMCYIL